MNYFISFADSRMTEALARLRRQAEALEFFHDFTLFTEQDLSPEFVARMGKYLSTTCKGFGYWSWKPWIIHHTLQRMNNGDRLLYLDAGCHINPEGKERFYEYVHILDESPQGMLVFYNDHPEYKWTKGDAFRHFSVSMENNDIIRSRQIAAGHVLLQKTPQTVALIEEWLHVFYNHLHLVDNSPSATPNLPGFIENRYDQSIFSLLCKRQGVLALEHTETYSDDWEQMTRFPFQDRRDTGLPRRRTRMQRFRQWLFPKNK